MLDASDHLDNIYWVGTISHPDSFSGIRVGLSRIPNHNAMLHLADYAWAPRDVMIIGYSKVGEILGMPFPESSFDPLGNSINYNYDQIVWHKKASKTLAELVKSCWIM